MGSRTNNSIQVTAAAPSVSLLQFADDSLIFCEGFEDHIRNVKAILTCFEAVLGLKINFFKNELIGIRVGDIVLRWQIYWAAKWDLFQSNTWVFPFD